MRTFELTHRLIVVNGESVAKAQLHRITYVRAVVICFFFNKFAHYCESTILFICKNVKCKAFKQFR